MKLYFLISVFFSIIVTLHVVQGIQLLLVTFDLKGLENIPPNLQILFYCACSGALIAFIFNKSIIKPIKKLSLAAQKVADGDFGVLPKVKTNLKELNHLFENFNIMVVELGATETIRKDFISNVSHEFKTPLNAIEGYATLLQEVGLTDQERAEYTDKIIFNTRRLSDLVGNILMLAKLDNQHIPLDQNQFKLDEQIRHAIVILEDNWVKKDMELDVELEDVSFVGPEALCSHIWINLIDNAIKYTPARGEISIRLKRDNDNIVFTIVDNGIGMSKEILSQIFNKFYQGDTSHHNEGNGLGLALVKQVVAMCGGEIVVESILSKGSKFTVTLPTTSIGRVGK
ncbi:HAMP domain-containing sensor histidine kinase [Paenibacillus lautus]|uniref:HAMP domain-containing sensor histidine kinase n=1 Tax=Paenibacillus lautus TaxID=1401 RepID=UPI003D9A39CE